MHSALANSVIRAKNYTNASRTSADIKHVFIHTMESPEGLTTAEDVSRWAAGSTAPQASWHYAVDANTIVSCVEEEDVAWATPDGNHDGIQIELAGRAGQTAAQWADAFSRAELVLAAKLVADVCRRRALRAEHGTNFDLKANREGVYGHVQASQVWPVSSTGKKRTHWDPGPDFPWDKFMKDVQAFLDGRKWQVRLYNKDGQVVDRSTIVGTKGIAARYLAFSTRVAPKVAAMAAKGMQPRIRVVRV
jgi:N-acetyl-anhydromuramyl-L-alanine amidase AmpD